AMLTRHSGAAKRLRPSAIAEAALVWPPPVSEVMIRNFFEFSSAIGWVVKQRFRCVFLSGDCVRARAFNLRDVRFKRRRAFGRMRFLQLPLELFDLNKVFRVERQ